MWKAAASELVSQCPQHSFLKKKKKKKGGFLILPDFWMLNKCLVPVSNTRILIPNLAKVKHLICKKDIADSLHGGTR
jgi:hypothetical protein